MRLAAGLALLTLTAALAQAAKPLEIYFIDVEGGQTTLVVTPSKQSILIDAGWPGFNNRDADRIVKAAKQAGVKTIDYLVVTHYHSDHVGGVPQIAAKMPVKNFVDHGPNTEKGRNPDELYRAYEEVAGKAKRIQVKPGDTLPLKGVEVKVLTADGHVISGNGSANPLCTNAKNYPADPTENARSLGTLITYGKFKMIDLGDLTSQKELALVCPENKVGTVDLYLTTHHGMDVSNAPEIVHALRPRVAIMNNGARKGGAPAAWKIIRSSPGLEDLWQVHYSVTGKTEANSPETFIANLEENCQGQGIRVAANADGSFTVVNSRNKYTKSYPAR